MLDKGKTKKSSKNSIPPSDPYKNWSAQGRVVEPVSSNKSIIYNEQFKKTAQSNKKYPTVPFGGDNN